MDLKIYVFNVTLPAQNKNVYDRVSINVYPKIVRIQIEFGEFFEAHKKQILKGTPEKHIPDVLVYVTEMNSDGEVVRDFIYTPEEDFGF